MHAIYKLKLLLIRQWCALLLDICYLSLQCRIFNRNISRCHCSGKVAPLNNLSALSTKKMRDGSVSLTRNAYCWYSMLHSSNGKSTIPELSPTEVSCGEMGPAEITKALVDSLLMGEKKA